MCEEEINAHMSGEQKRGKGEFLAKKEEESATDIKIDGKAFSNAHNMRKGSDLRYMMEEMKLIDCKKGSTSRNLNLTEIDA